MEDNELISNMESIISSLVQMGALGVMLAYMMYKEKVMTTAHQNERSDWHEHSQQHNDQIKDVIDKNTAAFAEHQATMARLCEKINHNQCKA